jgi:hypothetical protein
VILKVELVEDDNKLFYCKNLSYGFRNLRSQNLKKNSQSIRGWRILKEREREKCVDENRANIHLGFHLVGNVFS